MRIQYSATLFLGMATLVCSSGVAQAASLTTIASGLNNPRGITFGPDGSLYVAEAGIGGDGIFVPAPELDSVQAFGLSGSITRIRDGDQTRVLTDLPSLSLFPEGTTPPQTVGALLPATGLHDIEFDQAGNPYGLFGYATTTDQQDALTAVGGGDLGNLLSFDIDEGGAWQRGDFSIDLVAFEELDNPDDGAFLNNPFDLEVQGNRFYIADPGGNNFYSADFAGNVALDAVFPPEVIDGTAFERVPTSVAVGPDGAFYIGELTGNFSPPGSARVLRVPPGGDPEVFAEGFTQIIGLDFDSSGNLYVLEFSVSSDEPIPTEDSGQEFTGRLVKLSADGSRSTLIGAGEGLVGPTGLTVGPDDEIYVSNFGITISTGQVVRIDAMASVPEPASALALLVVGVAGGRVLKRASAQVGAHV